MIARILVAALATAVAALIVWRLWGDRPPAESTPPPVSPPAATATATGSPVPTVDEGYRLAGTAAGLRGRYAVFEDPAGGTEMYKIGDEIPGLGRLTRVGETDAAVATAAGERGFRVRPAPTRVPENTPSARPLRTPSPRPAPSAGGSSPSDAPAPPAS